MTDDVNKVPADSTLAVADATTLTLDGSAAGLGDTPPTDGSTPDTGDTIPTSSTTAPDEVDSSAVATPVVGEPDVSDQQTTEGTDQGQAQEAAPETEETPDATTEAVVSTDVAPVVDAAADVGTDSGAGASGDLSGALPDVADTTVAGATDAGSVEPVAGSGVDPTVATDSGQSAGGAVPAATDGDDVALSDAVDAAPIATPAIPQDPLTATSTVDDIEAWAKHRTWAEFTGRTDLTFDEIMAQMQTREAELVTQFTAEVAALQPTIMETSDDNTSATDVSSQVVDADATPVGDPTVVAVDGGTPVASDVGATPSVAADAQPATESSGGVDATVPDVAVADTPAADPAVSGDNTAQPVTDETDNALSTPTAVDPAAAAVASSDVPAVDGGVDAQPVVAGTPAADNSSTSVSAVADGGDVDAGVDAGVAGLSDVGSSTVDSQPVTDPVQQGEDDGNSTASVPVLPVGSDGDGQPAAGGAAPADQGSGSVGDTDLSEDPQRSAPEAGTGVGDVGDQSSAVGAAAGSADAPSQDQDGTAAPLGNEEVNSDADQTSQVEQPAAQGQGSDASAQPADASVVDTVDNTQSAELDGSSTPDTTSTDTQAVIDTPSAAVVTPPSLVDLLASTPAPAPAPLDTMTDPAIPTPSSTAAPVVINTGVVDAAPAPIAQAPAPFVPDTVKPALPVPVGTPIVATTAAPAPVSSGPTGIAAVDSILASVPTSLLSPIITIKNYMEMMKPGRPQDPKGGAAQQVNLYRAMMTIVNKDTEHFEALFTAMLRMFEHGAQGVFQEAYVYRFTEHVVMNAEEIKAWQKMVNLFKVMGPVDGRALARKAVNIEQSVVHLGEAAKNRVLAYFSPTGR